MTSMSAQSRLSARRMLLVCVAVIAASACATSPPQQPKINVALARVRSAELDATYTYYSTTLTQAGEDYTANVLDVDAFRRIYAAGANLHRAYTLAAAEQKLYLAGGNNTPTYDAAFAELKSSRTNLELVNEKAHRHGDT